MKLRECVRITRFPTYFWERWRKPGLAESDKSLVYGARLSLQNARAHWRVTARLMTSRQGRPTVYLTQTFIISALKAKTVH